MTGEAGGIKFRTRRGHKFTLNDDSGIMQAFQLNSFCVTTDAHQVYFKAEANNNMIAFDRVRIAYCSFRQLSAILV